MDDKNWRNQPNLGPKAPTAWENQAKCARHVCTVVNFYSDSEGKPRR